jgi:hypothetical protein
MFRYIKHTLSIIGASLSQELTFQTGDGVIDEPIDSYNNNIEGLVNSIRVVDEGILDLTTSGENDQRQLQQIKDCPSIDNCFTCRGSFTDQCQWRDNQCIKKNSFSKSTNKWYENYDSCPDEKKICKTASQNKTFFQFEMTDETLTPKIPENYFCKFQITLEADISWQLLITRFNHFQKTEFLEVMVDKDGLKSTFDNDYIQKQSVLFMDENGRVGRTSHFNIILGKGMEQIDLYVLNMKQQTTKTFSIVLKEEVKTKRQGSTLYTILSALFSFTICCLCVLACCRCFMSRNGSVDYNVDEPDANWDNDQMRVY